MGSSHFLDGDTDTACATRSAGAAYALAGVWFAVVVGPLVLAGEPSSATAVDRTAAERGYQLLTTKQYQRVDITPDLFEKLWQQWPATDREAASQATADERRRMAFSRYGLIASPDHPQGPPLGAVLGEKGGWALNCFGCHGGKVAGRAMPGLGNSHYAFQTLSEEMYAARRPPGEKSLMSKAASVLAPPLGKSNGTTNAQTFSVLLCARRDLDLNANADKPLPKFQHYDLDPPPLWNTKKKDRLYIDGFVKKTPRAIMQFVLTPENSGATVRGWEQDFVDILAWIESLEPPKYPWKVDGALAAVGKPIFERTCSECHGTYGPQGTYPERRVALDEIGTDDARLKGMPAEHRRFMRDSWLGYYGKYEVVEEPDGYVAPPLDGVWASAPYFHNGSVPTLWHLLHAESRPRVWLRSEDGYDEARVGLEVTELAELPASAQDGAEKRRYFDTQLRGKSGAGHTFPEQLSEEEKRAVLEYLKTL
jgi:mono/diheme cytochrome c family protein